MARGRDRLAGSGTADILDAGDEVAHLTGPELVHRTVTGVRTPISSIS